MLVVLLMLAFRSPGPRCWCDAVVGVDAGANAVGAVGITVADSVVACVVTSAAVRSSILLLLALMFLLLLVELMVALLVLPTLVLVLCKLCCHPWACCCLHRRCHSAFAFCHKQFTRKPGTRDRLCLAHCYHCEKKDGINRPSLHMHNTRDPVHAPATRACR